MSTFVVTRPAHVARRLLGGFEILPKDRARPRVHGRHVRHRWRATITGTLANSTTAALTEPNNIPTNPPRP